VGVPEGAGGGKDYGVGRRESSIEGKIRIRMWGRKDRERLQRKVPNYRNREKRKSVGSFGSHGRLKEVGGLGEDFGGKDKRRKTLGVHGKRGGF